MFRLETYHLVQKGPSFRENIDERFDRSGKYQVRRREAPDKNEETVAGTVAVPTDTYNGMTSILLKNLAKGASPSTHLLAFTPKPSVPELHSAPEGTDVYSVGRADSSATRFVMKPEVSGLSSVVATAAGKQPQPFRMWIADGKAPALVYFEGPMYADGPIWRIGLSAPRLDLKAR